MEVELSHTISTPQDQLRDLKTGNVGQPIHILERNHPTGVLGRECAGLVELLELIRGELQLAGGDFPALRGRHAEASARNVKLGRGGIREVEFLVQALQLLYGGDDPWLRERNSLKALFRLTERGYLAPDLGRRLSHALVHLRTVEHRLQILHEFQTHTLPDDPVELGRLARRLAIDAPPRVAARRFTAEHRAVTRDVHRAFREFFGERPAAAPARPRLPSRRGPTPTPPRRATRPP